MQYDLKKTPLFKNRNTNEVTAGSKNLEAKPLKNSIFKKVCMEDLSEKIRREIKLNILLPNTHFHI